MKREKHSSLHSSVCSLQSGSSPPPPKTKTKKTNTSLENPTWLFIFFSPSWSKISKHNPDFNLVMSQSEKNQQTLVRKWIKKPIFCHVAFLSCAIKLGRNSQKWKTRRKTLLKPNLAGSFFFFFTKYLSLQSTLPCFHSPSVQFSHSVVSDSP